MSVKPAERHATARALAGDIEGWMADESTSAWVEPFSVRARRWMRRNRTTVAVASVARLASLVAAAAVLAVQAKANVDLHEANLALSIANEKETKANAELRQANIALEAAKEREAARFTLAIDPHPADFLSQGRCP